MKTNLTIFIFFCCVAVHAQNVFYNGVIPYDYYTGVGKKQPNRIKLEGVQQQESICYSVKGELSWKNLNTYNRAGYLVANNYYKKDKLKRSYRSIYMNDTLYMGNMHLNGKGDTISQNRYEYDTKGREIRYVQSNKGRRSETHYVYNDRNKKEKSLIYKNGKIKTTYEYVYNDEGKMIRSLQYNAKNKLVRQITYQCDYRGETVSSEVKQVNMCLRKDPSQEDGGYIVYNDRTDEKGRLTRTIYRYDKDTNMVSYENFDSKGKQQLKQLYTYDASGNNIERKVFRKGKMWHVYRYNYNPNQLLASTNYLSKEGEIKSKQVYQYKYF